MPATQKKFDFLLDGKGYLLYRQNAAGPRSWQRTGMPDTPQVEQPRIASEFGGLPGQIDYPEVWNDWSGGFGYAYRHPRDENSYFGFLANPNFYHWSINFDARFERQLVHAQKLQTLVSRYSAYQSGVLNMLDVPYPSLAIPIAFGGLGGIYMIATTGATTTVGRLYPTGLSTAGSKFDMGPVTGLRSDLGGNQAGYGKPAIWGSFIYIPGGDINDKPIQDTLDDSISPELGNATHLKGFCVSGNRLWAYMGLGGNPPGRRFMLNSIAAYASGSLDNSANYSATLTIGNNQHNINDMVSLAGQLFVGTEDGLYAGDQTGTFFNVLGDLSSQSHPHNFRDLAVHNGQVVGQHITGIYAYSPSSTLASKVRQIGPVYRSNKSPIIGQPHCLAPLGPWLFMGLWTGSQGIIMAGVDPDGVSAYDWFPMQAFPAQANPMRIHIDGVTQNSADVMIPSRMWVATDPSLSDNSGTCPLYYFEIPAMHGNPLLPSPGFTPNFTNSARIDLGNTNGRAPLTPKIYRSVEIQADNLDGSQRWGLMYYMIDEGPRTLLGTFNSSPQSVLYFPSNQGSFVMGQSIELSMESYIVTGVGAEATTPVYRGVVLRQTYAPRSVDIISAIVDTGFNQVDRMGSPMRPPANQINELRSLVATGPVLLHDIVGNESWVKVLAPIEEQEAWQEAQDYPSVLATVKMAVLSFSGPATGGS